MVRFPGARRTNLQSLKSVRPVAVRHATSHEASIVLDETNERIVQILSHRGRISITDMAVALGRSESTVRERLDSLEARGVVLGYQARVDWAVAGMPVLAVFDGDCPPEHADVIASRLEQMPGVVQALATTGRPNLVVLARVRRIGELEELRVRLAAAGLLRIDVRLALRPLVSDRPPIASPGPARLRPRVDPAPPLAGPGPPR